MYSLVQKHFNRPRDSYEEQRQKPAMVIFCLVLMAMTACFVIIFFVSPSLVTEEDSSSTTKIYGIFNTLFIFVSCFLLLVGLKCVGLTPGFRIWCIAIFFLGVTSTIVTNPATPWHFFYMIPLDCLLAFQNESNTQIVDCLSYVIQIWIVLYVSVMVYTESGTTDVGREIYPIEPSISYSKAGHWMCGAIPILLNFNLMRWYARNYRKQARRTEMAVELSTLISSSLANYDLDNAKELLQQAETLSKAQGGFRPEMFQALSTLLANLQNFRVHLPTSLFTPGHDADPPNEDMAELVQGRRMDLDRANGAVSRLRDPSYSLAAFQEDVEVAFPEMQLYETAHLCSSGWSGFEEHQRTMGAMYATYCLARLDIDGKEVFTFGVDAEGRPCHEPHGDAAAKQRAFYNNMNWNKLLDLTRRAGLLYYDSNDKLKIKHDRMLAFLALTAIHDIMKNPALLPTVKGCHAPYDSYVEGCKIIDHDLALAYVMEYFPQLLPSFQQLEPGQRAPVLFTQGKMGFNNGWLVQGEAPPGALFSKFKRVIMHGGASEADISFYFVHWLTDLAGAEPYHFRPWPGAEKFVTKFPMKVLMAFLESFAIVDRLASKSEVEVMEDYLHQRWKGLGLSESFASDGCIVAVMRLALMAQGFEADAVAAFRKLPTVQRKLLSTELARTGCQQQFLEAPPELRASVPQGPALLIYYAPALVQKAGPEHVCQAFALLADVLAAARTLFPLDSSSFQQTVSVRIDSLKVLTPDEIEAFRPWHLRRTSPFDAEVARGLPDAGADAAVIEPFHSKMRL